ncbi:MAG: hypothetical protein ACRDN9_09335 [Streptosporangiaceae bacterium]
MQAAPDHLPLLARGAHRDPADGVCLMEYVSVLAGEPFSDHPECTDPLLAHVARRVNDTISDQARPGLAILAPDLIGTSGSDPRFAPTLVARCVDVALRVDPSSRRMRRLTGRAERHFEGLSRQGLPGLWARVTAHVYPRTRAVAAVGDAIAVLAGSSRPDRDDVLRELLAGCIADHRGLHADRLAHDREAGRMELDPSARWRT